MKNPLDVLKPKPPEIGEQIVQQLTRLNDNFDRYLSHLGARPAASKQLRERHASEKAYVGEPTSEFEQALKEHAELTGVEYKPTETE